MNLSYLSYLTHASASLMVMIAIAAPLTAKAQQPNAPFDPMRKPAAGVPSLNTFDPMRRPATTAPPNTPTHANLTLALEPMAYYTQRRTLDPNNPMSAWLATSASSPTSAPPDPQAPFGGMPPGDGRELTFAYCGMCHSTKLVTQQHLTPDRWDYLWDWMIKEHRMPPTSDDVRKTILGYLKEHYSASPR
jgi:hypothetical protein